MRKHKWKMNISNRTIKSWTTKISQ